MPDFIQNSSRIESYPYLRLFLKWRGIFNYQRIVKEMDGQGLRKGKRQGIQMLKKTIIALAGLFLIMGACSDNDINSPNGSIHGSGHFITETFHPPDFNSVVVNTVATVRITQGDNAEIVVTVDDNISDYIVLGVLDGALHISSRNNVNLLDFTLVVDVTTPDIEAIYINGVADVVSENRLAVDHMYLELNGVGSIMLDITAYQIYSNINSVSNIDLRGSAVRQIANISSVGNLNAFDLETDTTYVSNNSVGNAYVKVNRYLHAAIDSFGSIYYKGYPAIHLIDNNTGRLINAN
jgi:hypothetical protein